MIARIGASPSHALVRQSGVPVVRDPVRARAARAFTRNRDLMGGLVNKRVTTAAASVIATIIICLNVYLLEQTFFG